MPSPPSPVLLLLALLGTTAMRSTAGQPGGRTLPRTAPEVRLRRGTVEDSKSVQQYVPGVRVEFPRPINSASLHPTKALVPSSTDPAEQQRGVPTDGQGVEPRANLTTVSDRRLQIQNPLYPVTESSYSAYAVMFLSLIVFAVGIIGNLSVMCIVWHNYYMKSAWNSILASLAFWDFLILFFCLPVVIFNEITKKRLLGDISCRIVPFMEVRGCAGPSGGSSLPPCFGVWHGAVCPRPHCGAPQGAKGRSQCFPSCCLCPGLCSQHRCPQDCGPMKPSFVQPSVRGIRPSVCPRPSPTPPVLAVGAAGGDRGQGAAGGAPGSGAGAGLGSGT